MNPDIEKTLAELLMIMKSVASKTPPNWQRSLKSYSKFDWCKIGASLVSSDSYGATSVSWCGHVYTRRCGENKKYGAAIWFSRVNGADDGDASYVRLITFKHIAEAEPLPDYVVKAMR